MSNNSYEKFDEVVALAMHKLTSNGNGVTQPIALAMFACTAVLFVSPISTMAEDLVKSYMGTLLIISEDRERHLISYPSEPLLSEAALELLSKKGFEHRALLELDSTLKAGGILDAGDQGELAARLLFVSAWRRLICSERRTTKVCVKHSDLSLFASSHSLSRKRCRFLSAGLSLPFSVHSLRIFRGTSFCTSKITIWGLRTSLRLLRSQTLQTLRLSGSGVGPCTLSAIKRVPTLRYSSSTKSTKLLGQWWSRYD